MGCVTAAMKASAKFMGSSEVRAGLWNYSEIECEGEAIIFPPQDVIAYMIPWERCVTQDKVTLSIQSNY